MATWIKTGFWEKSQYGFKGWLNLDKLVESIVGNINNPLVELTNGAIMDLTATKQTLVTSSATRTFTISYMGDDITLEVILDTTSSTFTFPSNSLCVSEGVSSGNNILSLSGVSGDHYIIGIKNINGRYYIVSKNFGQ
jgi:hypothetical protein